MEEFCCMLPKVELHAHINGSCSDETISKLLKKKQQLNPSYQLHCDLKNPSNTGSLEKCFSKFRIIHELCDNEEAAYLVTSDVIKEFASDNVKYLELRTTPRDVPSTRMTKSSYVESVLKAIEDATSSSSNSSCDISVKLLLSIDRSRIEDAEETLKLVEAFSTQSDAVVVGLDLSGHPNAGDIKSLLPVLERARQNRIRMSLHIAEVPGCIEEVEDLISILPDRIGHATFLLPSHMNGRTDLVDKVIAHKIPIESMMIQKRSTCHLVLLVSGTQATITASLLHCVLVPPDSFRSLHVSHPSIFSLVTLSSCFKRDTEFYSCTCCNLK